MWRLRGNPLAAFVLPERCVVCNRESRWIVCDTCLKSLKPYNGPRCEICSKPSPYPVNTCSVCLNPDRSYERGFSLFSYSDNTIKTIVEHLKFYNKPSLAGVLGLFEEYIRGLPIFKDADLLIPVPMHRKDIMERGYNHTTYIAKAVADITGIPVGYGALKKIKRTRKQVGLGYAERIKNLKGAFEVRRVDKNIKTAVIIDDVFTTGSTINECSRVLSSHGVVCRFFTIATTPLKEN